MNWTEYDNLTKDQLYDILQNMEQEIDHLTDEVEILESDLMDEEHERSYYEHEYYKLKNEMEKQS